MISCIKFYFYLSLSLSNDDVQSCVEYAMKNATDESVIQNVLKGLYLLKMPDMFRSIAPMDASMNDFAFKNIYPKEYVN